MGFFDFLDPVVDIVGGILGRNDAQEANQMSWDQMLHQNAFNARQAQKANKRNRQNMRLSDRLNDKNTRLAQRFQAREALKSRKATDRAAIRARGWAQDDYAQQKADMADQFVRLRRAAKKGGFNPLTALGSAIVPSPAGGITSSSYAAASGVGAASVSAPGASQAMGGYGQPVAVPSLASNEAITGGISELGRELSGEAAIERANAQLYHDIAKIELEQMKARIPQPVVPSMGGSGLGIKPVAVAPVAAQPVGWNLGGTGSWFNGRAPDQWRPDKTDTGNKRGEELEPVRNINPMQVYDSDLIRKITGGVPVHYPTDGDEALGGAVGVWGVGVPAATLRNRVTRPAGEWIAEHWNGGRGVANTVRQYFDNSRSFSPGLGTGTSVYPEYVNPLY